MARILVVGNYGLLGPKANGNFYYNSDSKIYNGLVRAGHAVLAFSDRDVARASNIFGSRKLGIGATNAKLLKIADNFRPDMLLLGHANIIRNDTIAEIKSRYPDMRAALYNVDSLALDSHQDNVKAVHNRLPVVETVFITTGGNLLKQFVTPKNKVSYVPNAVDASCETGRNFERSDLPADLIYCVGGMEANDIRIPMIQYLQDHLSDIRLELCGIAGRPSVWGAAYQDLLKRAKMGLNFSRPNDVYLYASDRMAHLLGNGLLTLTGAKTGFQRFFDESEMVYYTDNRDLADKARYYARNDAERRRIAEAGWHKAHREFNATLVAQYMVELSLGLEFSHAYLWADEIYRK